MWRQKRDLAQALRRCGDLLSTRDCGAEEELKYRLVGVGVRSVDVVPTSIEHRLVGHRFFAMTSLLVLLAGVA